MFPFLAGLALVLVGCLVIMPTPLPTLAIIFGVLLMAYGAFTFFGGGGLSIRR